MMKDIFKIASWNPCHVLSNKKDRVDEIMINNKINIYFIQENILIFLTVFPVAYSKTGYRSGVLMVWVSCHHQEICCSDKSCFWLNQYWSEMWKRRIEICQEVCLKIKNKKFVVYLDRWHPGWGSTCSGAPHWCPLKYHPVMGVVHL